MPWSEDLARYGQACVASMLRGWWQDWKSRGPVLCSVGAVLEQVARAKQSTPVEGLLQQWMRGCVALDELLTPAEAAEGLGVWRQEVDIAARGALPRRLAGPGVRREGGANHYRVGRLLFNRLQQGPELESDGGRVCATPGEVEAALWESRREVWGTVPDLPDTV